MSERAGGSHSAARVDVLDTNGRSRAAGDVAITFDGATVVAREGEPVIAALLAAGVRVLRTMPRTGEARGGFCVAGRCSDCMMVIDGVPNTRACVTPVRAGMSVETQRGLGHWPGGEA